MSDPPFVPSEEWQDVPDWAILPNGGHYLIIPHSGTTQARWDEPVPGAETVMDKRGYKYSPAATKMGG